jgi:hypothetical protein
MGCYVNQKVGDIVVVLPCASNHPNLPLSAHSGKNFNKTLLIPLLIAAVKSFIL